MAVFLKILQLIFAFSLLVLVHEFGHFICAKIFKIRVEKFYLFFPPTIFKFKPKHSETEFGIGCIPLGGFCKISGMIDESMDTEQMAKPPQPWEFRAHPAWQRLIIMAGGVLMNVIFAIILYILILFTWGEEYLKTDNAVYGIEVNALSEEIGFRSGDKILAFEGEPVPENFAELQISLVRNKVHNVTVLRGEDTVNVHIDPVYMEAMLNTPGMFMLRAPIAIGGFPDSSINMSTGLMQGDKLVRIGDDNVQFYSDLKNSLGSYAGESANLIVKRNSDTLNIPVEVNENGQMEVFLQNDISDFEITEKDYSLVSAIPAGFKKTFTSIGDYVKELGLLFSPNTNAYKSVGSVIAIGSIFPAKWNWQIFWNITALLSIILAVMNLLPIPALDGGHILFTLYEMITGRKPSDKFMTIAQTIGMIILFLLMILAFGNDIMRLIK